MCRCESITPVNPPMKLAKVYKGVPVMYAIGMRARDHSIKRSKLKFHDNSMLYIYEKNRDNKYP